MGIRTSDRAVRGVIDIASGTKTAIFIETASALVDKLATWDTDSDLSTALLIKIETYLAAHFAALYDQQYESKKTGDASATFQGKTAMRLDGTQWGQAAMTLDVTGRLAQLSRTKHRVSLDWLGLPPSEQTDFQDRD